MSAPTFGLDLDLGDPPTVVWDRLWDLDRHTRFIPFTAVGGGPLGPGATFSGRTGLGPVGFTDTMVVRLWEPPRRCVVEKVGRPFGGRIEVTLDPTADGTHLRWRQSYTAAGVPDRAARLLRPLVAAGYRSSLRRIVSPG